MARKQSLRLRVEEILREPHAFDALLIKVSPFMSSTVAWRVRERHRAAITRYDRKRGMAEGTTNSVSLDRAIMVGKRHALRTILYAAKKSGTILQLPNGQFVMGLQRVGPVNEE